jgi:FHA domain
MYELTLEWQEQNETKIQKIIVEFSSQHCDRLVLGRNPQLCHLILDREDLTCSRLHAEIIFKSPENSFYLRKHPEASRPVIVDGKIINSREVLLSQNSVITLGKTEIKVTSISSSPEYMIICSNLKCLNPHPHRAVDAKYLFQNCPWCGNFLSDGPTFFPTKSESFSIRPINFN